MIDYQLVNILYGVIYSAWWKEILKNGMNSADLELNNKKRAVQECPASEKNEAILL
jgi:hypothetical protein